MPPRPCLTCGRLTSGTRCPACEREHSAPRRAYKAQRYDAGYRAERARIARSMAAGATYPCARGCGAILAHGSAWDLDHIGGVLAPSCPRCNRSAG